MCLSLILMKKNILKKINFEIKEGIKLGITGETGAGKSTLFHLMLGLLKPDTVIFISIVRAFIRI